MKYPPATWDEINAYYAEVRAENEDFNGPTQRLTSGQSEPQRKRMDNARREPPVLPSGRDRHQPSIRAPVPNFRREDDTSWPRSDIHKNNPGLCPFLSTHNFCVSPTEVVYTLEKLGTKVKWPPKMRFDPSTRKFDTFSEFH